jgi:hypothetical protein
MAVVSWVWSLLSFDFSALVWAERGFDTALGSARDTSFLLEWVGGNSPLATLSGRWSDVLVQMEQIVRIVLFFDLCQAIIVGAIGRGHPVAFFFGHEVYVCTI